MSERELVVRELQHRTRNLLAVVSGIAQQTRADSGTLDEFGDRFDQRLAALGRVQDFLSASVPELALDRLIALELTAHGIVPDGSAVTVAGPDVLLPPQAVQLLALAIHELTTNALKHGALKAGGRLRIDWTMAEPVGGGPLLRLNWREDGLFIASGVRHRGFGRELIEADLPYELDATTRLAFESDGVTCSIELPLA